MPQERRKYKRIAIKVPINWKIEKHQQKHADALLFDTQNITQHGLFLKTTLRPKKGSRIELELKVSNNLRPLKLKGKVAWVAKKRSHPYLYPGVGIEFAQIPKGDHKKLTTFLRYKFGNFRDALELRNMYLKLKGMASRLVELEERHSSALHFKNVIDSAINEIDEVAHILDREINEIKNM